MSRAEGPPQVLVDESEQNMLQREEERVVEAEEREGPA